MGRREFSEKMLTSSGISHKKGISEIGSKMLKMMGWKEGDGLGQQKDGLKECVQIGRRKELSGLGYSQSKANEKSHNWWEDLYNKTVKKISRKIKKSKGLRKKKVLGKKKVLRKKKVIGEVEEKREVILKQKIKRRKESFLSCSGGSEEEDDEAFLEFSKVLQKK